MMPLESQDQLARTDVGGGGEAWRLEWGGADYGNSEDSKRKDNEAGKVSINSEYKEGKFSVKFKSALINSNLVKSSM